MAATNESWLGKLARRDNLERDIRIAGAVLLLLSPGVHDVRRRFTHWRARWFEEESSLALQFERPGTLLASAGIQLLQLATAMKEEDVQSGPAMRGSAVRAGHSRTPATTHGG